MGERIPIVIPQMGVVEAVLVLEWLAEHGSQVAAGDGIVSVETEKAEVVLEAPRAGVLEILVPASDDDVPIGTTLGYIA